MQKTGDLVIPSVTVGSLINTGGNFLANKLRGTNRNSFPVHDWKENVEILVNHRKVWVGI